jgi:hypothetical protein
MRRSKEAEVPARLALVCAMCAADLASFLNSRRTGLTGYGQLFYRMLNNTLGYLDAFARFRQKENVEAVERLLSAHKNLAKFERAQIGNAAVLQVKRGIARD